MAARSQALGGGGLIKAKIMRRERGRGEEGTVSLSHYP